MSLNYNSVLKIFLKYYKGIKTKKNINASLISIIDPNYTRLYDSDFANELSNARRNISNELVQKANNMNYSDAENNSKLFSKTFTNNKLNSKIKYMINRIIKDDKDLSQENFAFYNFDFSINKIIEFDFHKYVICLIPYVIAFTKYHIDKPMTDDEFEHYENICKTEMPSLFFEDNDAYSYNYETYYSNAVQDITLVKTILYRQESVYLYDIFVAPDISTSDSFTKIIEPHNLEGKRCTTKNFIETFGKYCSITAPGGYGKSMFMKHLFASDSKQINDDEKSNLIPVYITVRQFIKEDTNLEKMIYNFISQYISISNEQFFSDLKKGKFLLLFDGLDEIKLEQSEAFFNELNELTFKYPDNYFITTSRPSEKSESLYKFKSLDLKGFNINKACQLIENLPGIVDNIKDDFNKILSKGEFDKNPLIASNPLLLTLMFMVYINKGKIPSKTYQFYEEAYLVLSDEHDKIKGRKDKKFATGLKRISFSKVLSEFCYYASTNQDYEFTEAKIISILNETSYSHTVNPDDFIYDMHENLNLFYLENGIYHFMHRSFQEYFTSCFFITMSDDNFKKLIKWFDDLKISKDKNKTYICFGAHGSGLFHLLNEMDPQRVKKFILDEVLKNYIDKVDSLDNYLLFLEKTFTNITYGYESYMEPNSHILKIIMEEFLGNCCFDTEYEEFPIYKDYLNDKLFLVLDEENFAEECYTEYELRDKLNEFCSEKEKDEWLEKNGIDLDMPTGYIYVIPIMDIIENKDDFSEMINFLISEQCRFRNIYVKLRNLYLN